MKTYTFNYGECDNGMTGWYPECAGHSYLAISKDGANIFAHDLVEHINGIEAIGCIVDEIQASGVFWKVRGQYGDLPPEVATHGEDILFEDFEGLMIEVDELGKHDDVARYADEPVDKFCECDVGLVDRAVANLLNNTVFDNPSEKERRAICGGRYLMLLGMYKADKKWPDNIDGNNLFNQVAGAFRNIHEKMLEASLYPLKGMSMEVSIGDSDVDISLLIDGEIIDFDALG